MDPDQALTDRLVRRYMGGLAHVHTIASNFQRHRESNLTLERLHDSIVAMPETPWKFIALAEHTANPSRPHALSERSPRFPALEAEVPRLSGLKIIRGVEVSVLPDGTLDVPRDFLDEQGLVIASRHSLPRRIEKNPRWIRDHFVAACRHPGVDVIGHPNRYVLEVRDVEWSAIFKTAYRSGTAVEVNLNIYPRWPRIGGARRMERSMRRWNHWLEILAESGAMIFIGTDVHQYAQLTQLQREWERATTGHPAAGHDRLTRLVRQLHSLGIGPERVVSRNHRALTQWLTTSKRDRKEN